MLTPSHALADEAADLWRVDGTRVAVLRGYEARDPASRRRMCADLDAVRAAITAGVDIQSNACTRGARRCAIFDGCLKQQNREEVEAADVIVAAYDVLFSGLPIDTDALGVILIDEGCWRRAEMRLTCNWGADQPRDDALARQRAAVSGAIDSSGAGVVTTQSLRVAGLTAEACTAAAALDRRGVRPAGLFRRDGRRGATRGDRRGEGERGDPHPGRGVGSVGSAARDGT